MHVRWGNTLVNQSRTPPWAVASALSVGIGNGPAARVRRSWETGPGLLRGVQFGGFFSRPRPGDKDPQEGPFWWGLVPHGSCVSCPYGSLSACGSRANTEAGGKPDADGSRRWCVPLPSPESAGANRGPGPACPSRRDFPGPDPALQSVTERFSGRPCWLSGRCRRHGHHPWSKSFGAARPGRRDCSGAGSRRHGAPGPPRRPAPGSPCSPRPERPGRSQGPAQLKVNKYVGKKEKMLLHFQPPVLVHGRQKTKAWRGSPISKTKLPKNVPQTLTRISLVKP